VERLFDIRRSADREELASHLPTFDARTFRFPRDVFVEGLAQAASFLNNPDWLVYQWGALEALQSRGQRYHVDLERIVELGLQLRDLATCAGFPVVLAGFNNPTQFNDTLFEVRVASMLYRMNSVARLVFGPRYIVRERIKTPEFDIYTDVGLISVECKQRHFDNNNTARRFQKVSSAIDAAMTSANWPSDLRLEVELVGPLREGVPTFAERLTRTCLEAVGRDTPILIGSSARAFVVPRRSPFRITEMQAGHDVLVIPEGGVTGLFNPEATKLRVAINSLDKKTASLVGAQVSDALTQLPTDHFGLIMLSEVPLRITQMVGSRRIDTPDYEHILAIGAFDQESLNFCFREERRGLLELLLNRGMRPLYTTS
jgi:hypothetical protein